MIWTTAPEHPTLTRLTLIMTGEVYKLIHWGTGPRGFLHSDSNSITLVILTLTIALSGLTSRTSWVWYPTWSASRQCVSAHNNTTNCSYSQSGNGLVWCLLKTDWVEKDFFFTVPNFIKYIPVINWKQHRLCFSNVLGRGFKPRVPSKSFAFSFAIHLF